MTFSEQIVTLLIWALTGCGAFFGIRAKLRQKTRRQAGSPQDRP